MEKALQIVLCIFIVNLAFANSCNLKSKIFSIFHLNEEEDLPGAFCLRRSKSELKPSCSLRSEDLPKGKLADGALLRDNGMLPKWVNLTLFRQGQKFAREYRANIGFGHIYGLISGGGKPDLVNVLLFTKNSNNLKKAVKRYVATITQIVIWYDNKLKDNDDDSVILKSLANVRSLHRGAAKRAKVELAVNKTLINQELCKNATIDKALFADFEKDLQASNISRKFARSYLKRKGESIPVNQFAHSLTQFAFVGFVTLYPERLLIKANDSDIFAFNHLWAVLGYSLGIEDKYNIALQPDLQHMRAYYQRILDDYWLPGLIGDNFDICSKYAGDVVLLAFEKITPVFTARLLLMTFLRDILKIPVPNLTANMTFEDKLKESALKMQHLPMLQHHTSRVALNGILSQYLQALGVKHFGLDYLTEDSKAENVFYA